MNLFKVIILLALISMQGVMAEEPLLQFEFRLLYADFSESSDDAQSNQTEFGISLYYQVNGGFEAVRSESWIPSEYAFYSGAAAMGLYVKDASVEGGYREVITIDAKDWWKRALIIVYADAASNRYKGRPLVFTKKQRETPGVHAFNLSGQGMQVTFGGNEVKFVEPGKMVYFDFPEIPDHRYRIQAAVKKGERWRKIVSAKRYMDPTEAYFSIFCQPKIGKDRYSVRLVTME